MAVYSGPKVTTDGLIYSIDPGNSRSFNIGSTGTSLISSVPGLTGNGNLRVGAVIGRRFGGTISLDGINDYITLPKMANWDPENTIGYSTITFELWVYPQDTDGASFLSRYYDSNLGIVPIGLNTSTGFIIRGRTPFSGTISTNWTFTINQWHHIVMAISPTTVTIYKNAIQSFSGNHGITLGYNGTFDGMNEEGVGVGTSVLYNYPPYEAPSSSLQGSVGIINVYNKILTQSEVQENYKTMGARYNV